MLNCQWNYVRQTNKKSNSRVQNMFLETYRNSIDSVSSWKTQYNEENINNMMLHKFVPFVTVDCSCILRGVATCRDQILNNFILIIE